ncbi:hypothetical protein Pcinc_032280 [Petrolisthes cinctipes]|uniref:Regulatory protein zeste n=1 Tax=Petrolisthes cinctipes TaxID=88211 RepID=A0AAE1EUG8_PETCI|nr:hypothetical protein Pcinc_032280 [Petrolisthes cinctipes]
MENTRGVRTKYITAEQRTFLLNLIEERKSVLFDKSHDHRMVLKKDAWTEVSTIFNSTGIGPQRSQQQLKKIWENSKGKAKKHHAAWKRETWRTGGGAPPKEPDDETKKILRHISEDLDDLGNDLNSDARPSNVGEPVVLFDGDIELLDHTYAVEEPNTTQTTPQRTTTLTSTSQHIVTPKPTPQLTVNTTTLTLDDTPTQSPQTHTIGTSSQKKRSLTSQHTLQQQKLQGPLARKKRWRVVKFTQEVSYSAALDLQRREHELTMKSLQLEIELKEKALTVVEKFSQIADKLISKFSSYFYNYNSYIII